MNFRRAFKLWSKPASVSPLTPLVQGVHEELENNQQRDASVDHLAEVIQLQPGSPLDVPAGLNCPSSSFSPEPTHPRGLLEAAELQAFFAENHFGLGRHNGAQYMTPDALALGRQTLIARFQNTLDLLISQRQAKIDVLRDMALQTQGMCSTVTSRLALACQRLERDISTIREQSLLASDGKGWILRALNEYEIGFGKGLREAVDMELLG